MHSINTTMPPTVGPRQTYAKGPFRTHSREVPRVEPDDTINLSRRGHSAILIGEAGCNLVLSRLQAWGMPAQPAMAGLAYDLIADVKGLDLLRMQVKTRSKPRGSRCSFVMTRGFHYSKAGMFPYAADDYDIAAFVCLSLGQVFFCVGPVHRISVRTAWLRSPKVDRETFDLALSSFSRRRRAEDLAWLASMAPDSAAKSTEATEHQSSLFM